MWSTWPSSGWRWMGTQSALCVWKRAIDRCYRWFQPPFVDLPMKAQLDHRKCPPPLFLMKFEPRRLRKKNTRNKKERKKTPPSPTSSRATSSMQTIAFVFAKLRRAPVASYGRKLGRGEKKKKSCIHRRLPATTIAAILIMMLSEIYDTSALGSSAKLCLVSFFIAIFISAFYSFTLRRGRERGSEGDH